MRISLDNYNNTYSNYSSKNVDKEDKVNTYAEESHSSEATGSTITSFEDMLVMTMSGREYETYGEDSITQASDLSVKELTELYIKLGIDSPAGTKSVSNSAYDITDNTVAANQTASLINSLRYPACNVEVPEKYVEYFKNAAAKYNLPYELLVSVAKAESDFNKDDTSRSGAMGIMQLMPATAKYLGVDNAYDPEQNIMGGARYLSEKLEKHGSVELALAAYNAGSNAVEKYNGIPPYTETQNYVKKIMGYLGS